MNEDIVYNIVRSPKHEILMRYLIAIKGPRE